MKQTHFYAFPLLHPLVQDVYMCSKLHQYHYAPSDIAVLLDSFHYVPYCYNMCVYIHVDVSNIGQKKFYFFLSNTIYSGSVVKTKIQAFYNEPIYVTELERYPIKQHDQSAVPDNNMMWVSDC